jgi:nucleotide-binding universal stress UspA family protein
MKRFKNILFFADGPATETAALERAAALADANQARLTVIDVVEPADAAADVAQRFGIDIDAVRSEQRLEELQAMTAPLVERHGMILTKVLSGTPFLEVVRAVQRGGHDLVMKSARPGGSLTERVFGSTDMHLLRKCPCPVWIDRPESRHPYRVLIAAVDPTDPATEGIDRKILDLATSLAAREQASLEVVHAWRLQGESLLRGSRARMAVTEIEGLLAATEQCHRDAVNRLLAHYGMTADDDSVRIVKGDAAAVISDRARATGADLIVMGTVARTGVPGLFIGNTAEDVLESTRTSVLTVKPDGFVSPVAVS